ncbi:hypothetical protein [Azospirillum sp.]|uniref:hypothetical protein n=1 Tax=Azospirillum sp. TaxID=34012 RepID=UPI003D75376C
MAEDTMNRLHHDLGVISGKLDSVLAAINSHGDRLASLEDRVGKLEQAKAWVLGAAAALGGAAGKLASLLSAGG